MQANLEIGKGISVKISSGRKVYFEEFNGAVPLPALGNNNDYAIDVQTNDIYLKTGGIWGRTGISAQIQTLLNGIRWITSVQYLTTSDISSRTGLSQTLDGQAITLNPGDRVASTNLASTNIYIASAGGWTIATPSILIGDTFFAQEVLSDPINERKASSYNYNGTVFTKLVDFDFESADSIQLSASYSPPASGAVTPVAGSDTIEVAIAKFSTFIANLIAQIGVLGNTSNLGLMVGGTVSDNVTVKQAIQAIVDKARIESSSVGVTAITTIDQVAVASFKTIEWDLSIFQTATPANRYSAKIFATTDGTSVSHSEEGISLGSQISGLVIDVDISAGNARLRIQSGIAVNVSAVRRVIA